MELVYADIQLTNAVDVELAKKHIIGQEEAKQIFLSINGGNGCFNSFTTTAINCKFIAPQLCSFKNEIN